MGKNLDLPRKETIFIGRSSSCDLKIQGIDVSSKHCKFVLVHAGNSGERLNVFDLSSNGLKINGELLGKGSSIILKTGDEIGRAHV